MMGQLHTWYEADGRTMDATKRGDTSDDDPNDQAFERVRTSSHEVRYPTLIDRHPQSASKVHETQHLTQQNRQGKARQ